MKYASLRAEVAALRVRLAAAESALAAERARVARARGAAAGLYEAVWPVIEAAHAVVWTLPDPAHDASVPVDRAAYSRLRAGLRELAREDDGEADEADEGEERPALA